MSESTWIYGLKEIDSEEIRYVGASVDPVVRMRVHMDGGSSRAVKAWVRGCKALIELVCLEQVPVGSAGSGVRRPEVAEAEDRWMVRLLDEGHDLLNVRRPKTHCEATDRDRKLLSEAIERGCDMFGED